MILFVPCPLSLPQTVEEKKKTISELVVKNLPAYAEDLRDTGSIPGLGDSLEEGMATHCSILAWRIPWTEVLRGLQSYRVAKSRTQLK